MRASGAHRQETRTQASSIVVLGSSFKSAPIAYRERLSSLMRARGLLRRGDAAESVALETCNRIELYLFSERPAQAVSGALSAAAELGSEGMYALTGRDAVLHLFRVTAGLDSMVPYDEQILSQVRAASKSAREAGESRPVLSPPLRSAPGPAPQERGAGEEGGAVGRRGFTFQKRMARPVCTRRLMVTVRYASTCPACRPVAVAKMEIRAPRSS